MARFVIAQSGVAGSGKTTTVRGAFEQFTRRYPKALVAHLTRGNVDVCAVVSLLDVKIGFESQGDPCSRLAYTLRRFVERGCDVIVCACRTRGETAAAVRRLHGDGYDIEWRARDPSAEEEQATFNRRESLWIVRRIEQEFTKQPLRPAI